jgi:hypothetical protein
MSAAGSKRENRHAPFFCHRQSRPQESEQDVKTLFTRVEQLIDQVFLNPAVGGQQMGRERLTESWFGVESADHFRFLDPHHAARS